MKRKVLLFVVLKIVVLATITAVLADDGQFVSKDMNPPPDNAPEVPEGYIAEAEHAFIDMMKFYVPSRAANGLVLPVEYYNVDDALVQTHESAKPLVSVFIYGPSEGVEGVGFVGHGKREAFGRRVWMMD